jgi:transcriptional regulator with XRE-family HTH domain
LMQDTLARKLRVLRAERGLTLREAEQLTGVDKDTLSKIERGLRHPYDVTLSKLAKGYGVPVEDLLEEPVPLAEAPREAGRTHIDQSAERLKSSGSKLPEVADLLLDLGQMLLLTWEAELPQRAAQDDDEWLANIVTMWRAFGLANYAVLDELGAERLRNQQGWLARYMDVNATIYRINAAIRKHSDTSEETPMMLEPLGVA